MQPIRYLAHKRSRGDFKQLDMAGLRCQSLVSKISYRRKKDGFMINLLQVCRTCYLQMIDF